MAYRVVYPILPTDIYNIIESYITDDIKEVYLKKYFVNLVLLFIKDIKEEDDADLLFMADDYYGYREEEDRDIQSSIEFMRELNKEKIKKYQKMNYSDIEYIVKYIMAESQKESIVVCPGFNYINKLHKMNIIKYDKDTIFSTSNYDKVTIPHLNKSATCLMFLQG